jgi:hypothetical protein
MGMTYRFLATVEEAPTVLDWFRSRPERAVESAHDAGSLFYFRDFGTLDSDSKKSPVVNVFTPVRKRGVLTTIGEVHFLATPLTSFPGLNKINKGLKQYGIYKVDGDRWTVFRTPPGGKPEDRPREFDSKTAKGGLDVWERVKDEKKR